MLFNSPQFLFVFLPAAFVLFQLTLRLGRKPTLALLITCSLLFYAWSEPVWVFVLIGMLLLNYALAWRLRHRPSRVLLTLALAANLGLLAYLKYTNFVIANLNALGAGLPAADVILPIGVSFFVFQQVAYLVDSHRGEVVEHGFLQYGAFITFFPHFIAGPILFHKDLLPQLAPGRTLRPSWTDIEMGTVLFAIGLAKKLLLADKVELFATPVFDAADSGANVTFLDAWGGVLAYTFQIYFDFSGYSDMAIGIARMFALRLPVNFNSPYKATSIIDFWRRWHMSLSRFLRDYLYFPLGGNRCGTMRRYGNLMAVMLLGGLWHGAGWGFLVWGGLHGLYLMVNHLWRHLVGEGRGGVAGIWASRVATFLAVVVAWVFFRAGTLSGGWRVLKGMLGLNGLVLDAATLDESGLVGRLLLGAGWSLDRGGDLLFLGAFQAQWLAFLLLVAWLAPNSQDMIRRLEAEITTRGPRLWQLRPIWLTAVATLLLLSLPHIYAKRPFLYFQF